VYPYPVMFKSTLKKLFSHFNLVITQKTTFEHLIQIVSQSNDSLMSKLPLLNVIIKEFNNSISPKQIIEAGLKSTSQLGQDLFVLSQLGFKEHGYFVEFGATNGVDLSNTLLLEKEFQWNGILAEPGKTWHEVLKSNREAHIDFSCVWTESNIDLKFNETSVAEFSTISSYSSSDGHSQVRELRKEYNVRTLSLNDLLEKYDAPRIIDYLSIDTEGSEYEILKYLDFDKWKFRVITCEHNFTSNRSKIKNLLSRNGYQRVFTEISKFDDWYILDQT
jgi:FkbM family methyltransferase